MALHSTLSGSELHEPKGVGTAAAGKVYVTDGAGSGTFEDHVALSDIDVVGTYEELLNESSTSTQTPSGLDSTTQVSFGAGSGSGSDPVQIDAAGTLTINDAGTYCIRTMLHLGRTSGASPALVHCRMRINAVPVGPFQSVYLTGSTASRVVQFAYDGDLSPGDDIDFEIVRDPGEDNSGEILAIGNTSTGWSASPSANIRVGRVNYAV